MIVLFDYSTILYNSLLWFSKNPQEKLDGLIKGKYLIPME